MIFLLLLFSSNLLATVRVEPAKILIKSDLGQRSTGTIDVYNNGEENVLLQAYLYDWTLDARDDVKTYYPGTLDNSLNGYIKFNPRSFILEPGKKQVVRFTITTPEELDRELRGIVFFEQETNLIDNSTGSIVKSQIGTVIYLTPDKVNYSFQLNDVRVLEEKVNNRYRFVVIMENKGEAHLRLVINYKIIDENNSLIEEGEFDQYVLLPDFRRALIFSPTNELKPGNYKLYLNYYFMNSKREKEYEIPITLK